MNGSTTNAIEDDADVNGHEVFPSPTSTIMILSNPQEEQLIARGKQLFHAFQQQRQQSNQPYDAQKNETAITLSSSVPFLPWGQHAPSSESFLDVMDRQLQQLLAYYQTANPSKEEEASPVSVVESLRNLIQQQRADASMGSKHQEERGTSEEESNDPNNKVIERYKQQVDAQQQTIEKLQQSMATMQEERDRLKSELAQLRQRMEQVEADKDQLEKAAMDKRTLLQRALAVKSQQLDRLCDMVELPPVWERLVDEDHAIVFYRRKDCASAPQLEDPRVPLAIQKQQLLLALAPPSSSSPPPSPRSAEGRMEQIAANLFASSKRRSSSMYNPPLIDIPVPPEDGKRHTVEDFETPLPAGWEMRVTTSGRVFFVNCETNATTWTDPRQLVSTTSVEPKPTLQRSASDSANTTSQRRNLPELRVEIPSQPLTGTFDVVFQDKGAIGIHFQANVPDGGAIVRRLLPGMAAAKTGHVQPLDRLVAINKNPVATAPFRHVMLLLQGGFRPLTLTFKRPETTNEEAKQEEIEVDQLIVYDGEDQAQDIATPTASTQENEQEDEAREETEEEFTIADRIITNLFSLFWTPPDTQASSSTLHTV